MVRRRQSEEVRQKVVNAALHLFLEKGYAQTTLREISAAAGVSYGSIYHHFSDKEGIFRGLILDNFEKTQDVTDEELGADTDVYLRLALKWATLMEAASTDPRIAELLSIAYRSPKISEELISVSAERHFSWLSSRKPAWGEGDFYAATVVLVGAMSQLIDERLGANRLSNSQRIEALIRGVLPGFGAGPKITEKVLADVLALTPSFTPSAMEGLL